MKKLGNNQYSKVTTEDIILRFKKIHNDEYDYSSVNYISMHSPVCIICKEHGEFWQIPHNHLKGQGCPECAKMKRQNNERKIGKEKLINEGTLKFKGKFDYSKVNYINAKTKVCIICPEHGEFNMQPYEHLKSQFGCRKCADKYVAISKINKNRLIFKEKADKIHNNKYKYILSDYSGNSNKIKIICPIHGEYEQVVHDHLQGCGCPKCGIRLSNAEEAINQLISNISQTIQHDRTIIKPLELDIYIPEKQIAIEYDGLIWHSEKYKEDVNSHLNKTNLCKEKGVRLIHIFEDEWLYKQEIVKSRLKAILGIKGRTIRASKCEIRDVDSRTAMQFLDENHMQGRCKAKYHYGLYYNDELVSLMTFDKMRQQRKFHEDYDEKWELLRFVNKLNTTVYGGASKLLKHFIKEVNPKSIISYADKRWSDGNLYKKLGFEHTHDSRPNYFYVVGQHRENRFKYRKGELVKQGFEPNKSEHEIMIERGIYRIYDCGTMVFEMKL